MCIFRFKVIKLVLMLDAFTPGSGDPLAGPWGPHWDWPTDIQDKMWSECYWSENGSYSNGLVSQWLHCWSCVWTIANFLQPFVRPACDKGSEAWPLRRWTTIVSLFLLSMLHLFSLCVCVCVCLCVSPVSLLQPTCHWQITKLLPTSPPTSSSSHSLNQSISHSLPFLHCPVLSHT